jgi:hypothetical protein
VKVVSEYRTKVEWHFAAEAHEDGTVWVYIRAGEMSGGLFMKTSDAVILANELMSAAEIAAKERTP